MIDGIPGTGILVGLKDPDGVRNLCTRIPGQHDYCIAVQSASTKGGITKNYRYVPFIVGIGCMNHREYQIGRSLAYRIDASNGRGDGHGIYRYIFKYGNARTSSSSWSSGSNCVGNGYR